MKELFFLFTLFYVFITSDSFKILSVFPHPGKSHFDFFEPLLEALAERGHEVTVISHFPRKTPLKGYKDISIADGWHEEYNVINITQIKAPAKIKMYMSPFILAWMGSMSCEQGYAHKAFQDFLKSQSKFDLVLIEYFSTDCFLPLAHIFKAPLIGISSCLPMPWTDLKLAYPSSPSYIPVPFIGVHDKMTFLERVENTIMYTYSWLGYKLLIDFPNNRIARKYFGDDLPPLQEIGENTSLVLANMHFSLTLPRPLVPGLIEVSGLNMKKPKNLPQNLEKWINESPHGVVYFSLGSMIRVESIPEERMKIFLKVLGRLPQRVIWKWEGENLADQPKNVLIQKWLPQHDVLCHPNVKGYISHGGLLGTTESVHCGVPMIVLPQFGDQFTNAAALERVGGGIQLDFWSLDEDSLYDALTTILEPSFQEKAKQLSERFNDRPMPAMDTAIYWVEYVARHKGAPHLKTAAVGMPFYQYLLFDVIAFILIVSLISIYVFYFLLKVILRKLFFRGSVEKLKKN